MTRLVTENNLDQWVRANARDAQGLIVELVWRLVAASAPRPKQRRFPLGDSIGQHGADGILESDLGSEPFVPEGLSFWEIGTGVNAGGKATDDYRDLTQATPPEIREGATFVFVTPLSGRRDWDSSWQEDAQLRWRDARLERREWRDVRVVDGTKLIDWLSHYPPVERWLAGQIAGIPEGDVETLAERWALVRSYGEPPPLLPNVFTGNREDASSGLEQVFADTVVQLRLETNHLEQAIDYVCAYVSQMPEDRKAEVEGRCLIVTTVKAWQALAASKEPLVLIADPSLDLSGTHGVRLIQSARRAGHAVIFASPSGGIPDPSSIRLLSPRPEQLEAALKDSGYPEERARTLVQRSGGNLSSLIRCVQGLSLLPAWAERTAAADLAIAAALGEWSDNMTADVTVAETVSGKSYGEWIQELRSELTRPNTPLSFWEGEWKFVPRFEGWYALGRTLHAEKVELIVDAAVQVLSEEDPRYELEKEKRFAASLYGKKRSFSDALRRGLANGLAMLASRPDAVHSVPPAWMQASVSRAVTRILNGASWQRLASLSDHLPLLAEAAPAEFLAEIERIANVQAPISQLFAEEGDGFFGGSLISGVLWALETLAWEPRFLPRVLTCLAALAELDPGGKFANRPLNSITTILLPWLPQTTAPVESRLGALRVVEREAPEVAWKTLLALLPGAQTNSSGSRRPAWRPYIPEDWSPRTSQDDYIRQVREYASLAVEFASVSILRAVDLAKVVDRLPDEAFGSFLSYVESLGRAEISDSERYGLWNALLEIEEHHRKFQDASWAMSEARLGRISRAALLLSPQSREERGARLFRVDSWSLLDGKGTFEEQEARLERARQDVLLDVLARTGFSGAKDFSERVAAPAQVGQALACSSDLEIDAEMLPSLLLDATHRDLVAGYVWARHRTGGWQWVDAIDKDSWTADQVSVFLTLLPFANDTWVRAIELLGAHEGMYWTTANAHFFYADKNPELGIRKLHEFGRPWAAIRGLFVMAYERKQFDAELTADILLAAVESEPNEPLTSGAAHEVVEVIGALQNNASVSKERMELVEWKFLALLSGRTGHGRPVFLERKIAEEAEFFCFLIRLIYRSEHIESREVSDAEKDVASQAYRLLDTWRTLPGVEGGVVIGEKFVAWFEAMELECNRTGHEAVALQTFGRALTNSPADNDGLWMDRAIAGVLNRRDLNDLRRGYELGVYNSRGAFWVDPTAAEERSLEEGWRRRAAEMLEAGFHRLAECAERVANFYQEEAADRLRQAQRE